MISLTPIIWLRDNKIILGHDSGFRLNPLIHLNDLFYSWHSGNNFGVDWSIFKGFLIIQFPETFFTYITHSLYLGQILTFIFWFFAMSMSMYVFVNYFFPDKKFWIFRLFSSTFYVFNFFLLQGWFIAERAKFSLYVALPLGLLILIRLLNKDEEIIRGTILFSLVFLFFNGGGIPNLYGSIIIAFAFTVAYFTIINFLRYGIRSIFGSLKIVICLFVGTLLLNFYLIVPQIYLALNNYSSSLASAGGISGVIAWEHMVNQYASIINLLRLEGIPDWYNNLGHVYAKSFIENPLLILLSFIPIIIIVFGNYLYKEIPSGIKNDKLFFLMMILFFVGIIFTGGSHPPFGKFYVLLIEHLPGFAIFRSAFYKFGSVYWFSFIFLTGYLLNLILITYVKKKYAYILIGITAIIFILFYHYPYFIKNFFDFNQPFTTKVKIPEYVNNTSSFINSDDTNQSRILLLPKLYPNFLADSYEWGFWSLDLLPRLSINRPIIANDSSSPAIINNLYDSIDFRNENEFLKLAGLMGINRVLWRDDVLYTDKVIDSKKLKTIEDNLKSFKSVSLEKSFEKWRLYRIDNAHYKSTIYTPDIFSSVNIEKNMTGSVFAHLDNSDSLLIFPDSGISKDIDSTFQDEFIQANCIYCQIDEIENTIKNIFLPSPELLPTSKFYSISKNKEEELIESASGSKSSMVDVDLSLSNKRISQIFKFLSINTPNVRGEIGKVDYEYSQFINDAISESGNLSPEEKNYYLIKIYMYLIRHRELVADQRFNDSYKLEYLKKLSKFQDKKIEIIKNNIWITDYKNGKIRYLVNINAEGNYKLIPDSKNDKSIQIRLNNKLMSVGEVVNLKQGSYRIEISMSKKFNPIIKDIYSNQSMEIPNIVFQRINIKNKKNKNPEIKFSKINPTKFLLSVSNAENPFILNFGDSFNRGWKLYYIDSRGVKSKIPESSHFESNGYANSWNVDHLGNFDMIIEYQPQRIFEISLIVSILSLIGYLIVLIKKK